MGKKIKKNDMNYRTKKTEPLLTVLELD